MKTDPADTRQAFLDAAGRVIRIRGLGGLTTKEVARAAGRSEGSLYNHFTDKVELVCEVVASQLPALIAVFARLEPGRRTVEENLRDVVRGMLTFYDETLPLQASIIGDSELRARHLAELRDGDRGPHRPHHIVAAYLAGEQELGRLTSDSDPQALAFLLLGACLEAVRLELAVGRDRVPIPRKQFPQTIVRTLLAGRQPITHPKEPS